MTHPNTLVSLKPIDAADVDAFFAYMHEQYVGERMRADLLSRAEAEALVAAQRRSALPDGVATANQHLLWAEDERAQRVGLLWLAFDAQYRHAFIYQIFVFEALRGRGYGRATLAAAETFAQALGARALALNVFTPNRNAIALYERAGFGATSQHMSKPL
jgi:ribosomal protein S18 acetylase RimI-like enzyme